MELGGNRLVLLSDHLALGPLALSYSSIAREKSETEEGTRKERTHSLTHVHTYTLNAWGEFSWEILESQWTGNLTFLARCTKSWIDHLGMRNSCLGPTVMLNTCLNWKTTPMSVQHRQSHPICHFKDVFFLLNVLYILDEQTVSSSSVEGRKLLCNIHTRLNNSTQCLSFCVSKLEQDNIWVCVCEGVEWGNGKQGGNFTVPTLHYYFSIVAHEQPCMSLVCSESHGWWAKEKRRRQQQNSPRPLPEPK